MSAILQQTVKLNKRTSEIVKKNYPLIAEEYDGETLTHFEAAKIKQSVTNCDLTKSNDDETAKTIKTVKSSRLRESGFIKSTDRRPTDPPTTFHLPTDPPATYPPTHRPVVINLLKTEDQILNMFCNLKSFKTFFID